jgi:uncharacterized membrane protein YvlD (DUF360 family)
LTDGGDFWRGRGAPAEEERAERYRDCKSKKPGDRKDNDAAGAIHGFPSIIYDSLLTRAFAPATLEVVSFLGYIVIQIAVNALALLAADYFVPGVELKGDFLSLVQITAVLAAFNIFLKPAVRLFFGPFILLTFGLFMIVVNAALLWGVSFFMPELSFATPLALLEAALIFSAGNFAIALARKAK